MYRGESADEAVDEIEAEEPVRFPVLARALGDRRRSLVWWSVGVAAYVAMIVLGVPDGPRRLGHAGPHEPVPRRASWR